MKFKILLLLFLAYFSVNLKATNKLVFKIPIRVLIEKQQKAENKNWIFRSVKGFTLLFKKNKKRQIIKSKILRINIKSGKLFINSKKYAWDKIYISSKDKLLNFNNLFYSGTFVLSRFNNIAYLANYLDLEDYVASVLPSESWPGWPDEVNKALSICIRSYAAAKIFEQKNIITPFDIKNNTSHLVYKGSQDQSNFKNLVLQTKNLVLAYKNSPILAMFDISCGGIVPSKVSGINFQRAPYLCRSYPCIYCQDYKCFKWDQTYSFEQLSKILKNLLPHLKEIRDIKIGNKDQAGVILDIKIKTELSWHTVKISELKSLLNFKSLYFDIEKKNKLIIFKGKGFGHLIGLCQFGLRQMIKEGWDYKDALRFFYPGTKLMKLTKK